MTMREESPDARVQSFMQEFEAQFAIAKPAFEGDSRRDRFAVWRRLMADTTAKHFTADTAADLGSSFRSPPEYAASTHTIQRSERVGDVAYVLTKDDSPLVQLNEFTLHLQDDGWRIHRIVRHFGEPRDPFIGAQTVQARIRKTAPDAAYEDMPASQQHLDEVRNFTERDVTVNGKSGRAEVSSIGTLSTRSGVIAVLDFGYGNDAALPLARSVAPGEYPVDRVTAFDRNAAVRVRFSEEIPVAWYPASIPSGGHVFGVDAGSVCIVDYPDYSAMSRRDKEARFEEFAAEGRPAAVQFPLGKGSGIAVDSGFGDGSYPAYWGVDAQGAIVQLVVDFMVLAGNDEDGRLTHI